MEQVDTLAHIYVEDPTTQSGAQEALDRSIFYVGLAEEVTTYSALAYAARETLGFPNTVIELTYDQDQAVSATIDAIALNLAEALTQPALAALNDSVDPVDRLVFATLQGMASAQYHKPESYERLNSQEKQVCRRESYDCYRSRNTSQYAYDWSGQYYSSYHPHNTRRDAHRHCVWTSLMTERSNSGFAERFGNAHEFGDSGQPTEERDMDLVNNAKGREVGRATEGRKDVTRADGCRNLINSGGLVWLR